MVLVDRLAEDGIRNTRQSIVAELDHTSSATSRTWGVIAATFERCASATIRSSEKSGEAHIIINQSMYSTSSETTAWTPSFIPTANPRSSPVSYLSRPKYSASLYDVLLLIHYQ